MVNKNMAKRKKSKESSSSFSYSIELTGIILLLIGIIGMGFGPIGKFVKEFAIFLAGEFYFIVLIFLMILGIHMLFKRKMPKFFSPKLIGIYLIIIVVLTLAHLNFLKQTSDFKEMMSITYENYMERIGTISSSGKLFASGDNSIVIGGGIIGALSVGALGAAFGLKGTIVVIVAITLFAIVLVFNVTIADVFKKILNVIKNTKKL